MLNLTYPASVLSHGLSLYLLRDELLTQDAMQAAIDKSTQQKIPFVSYLVRNHILSSEVILACCAKYFDFPIFDLAKYHPDGIQNSPIHYEFIHRYRILPLRCSQQNLHIGIADPTQEASVSVISFHTGLHVHPILVSEKDLEKILSTHYRASSLGTQLESTLSKIAPTEANTPIHPLPEQDDEPVTEFVNRLLHDAIDKNVSDIHIEHFIDHCRIRFRRDGLLYEAATIPLHLASRIMIRLKIMANLNIAERRMPQDGRLQMAELGSIDIRINTCPTLYGEKIVLRVLAANHIKLDIERLGLLDEQKEIFLSMLKKPQGLILVTGPTGSGKTITLYSALRYLNCIEKNISSVEDPVEIEFPGINQVNINPRIGLDFVVTLRSLLRQDPDIIMLGEIRDIQTANIAMQAAQTGHLVLSTLHTNSAAETITRLQSIGVAAYHFISSVSLIIAQRLIRKLCEFCKKSEVLTLPYPTPFTSYRAEGCEQCNQGYEGRIGIFECIPMTETLAKLILSQANTMQLLECIKQEKRTLLWDAGFEKIKNGLTSYAELTRVLGQAL